jgi:hypothetical protein
MPLGMQLRCQTLGSGEASLSRGSQLSTSIFSMPSTTSSTSPKLNFSHAELSSKYLDPLQPPTKGVPYHQIGAIPFAKHVRICMPVSVRESLYPDSIRSDVPQGDGGLLPSLNYAKATMTLKDVLEDENLRRGR